MLRIDHLTKRFGDHVVFQDLTHTFSPGCLALCDEESTGKSTLLAILAGAVAADAGEVWIDGHSLTQARTQALARVAYVPDDCLFAPTLTGRALLEQVAACRQVTLDAQALMLARELDVAAHLDKRFEQMSTGTRRKIHFVAAQLGSPAVMLADGPSAGLDARSQAVLVERLQTWAGDRVVLFASHDPRFVEACAARPVRIDDLR